MQRITPAAKRFAAAGVCGSLSSDLRRELFQRRHVIHILNLAVMRQILLLLISSLTLCTPAWGEQLSGFLKIPPDQTKCSSDKNCATLHDSCYCRCDSFKAVNQNLFKVYDKQIQDVCSSEAGRRAASESDCETIEYCCDERAQCLEGKCVIRKVLGLCG